MRCRLCIEVREVNFISMPIRVSYNLISEDVKPTNVLVNKKGEIKLCDFGVSGQLEKSLAKTNIGCQSYMAVSIDYFTIDRSLLVK